MKIASFWKKLYNVIELIPSVVVVEAQNLPKRQGRIQDPLQEGALRSPDTLVEICLSKLQQSCFSYFVLDSFI